MYSTPTTCPPLPPPHGRPKVCRLYSEHFVLHVHTRAHPLTSKLKVSRRCSTVSGDSSGMFLEGGRDEAGKWHTATHYSKVSMHCHFHSWQPIL